MSTGRITAVAGGCVAALVLLSVVWVAFHELPEPEGWVATHGEKQDVPPGLPATELAISAADEPGRVTVAASGGLPAPTPSLDGTAEHQASGLPFAGANVLLSLQRPAEGNLLQKSFLLGTTDASGCFSVRLPDSPTFETAVRQLGSGAATMFVTTPDAMGYVLIESVSLREGGKNIKVAVGPLARLEARVQTADGRALETATVVARPVFAPYGFAADVVDENDLGTLGIPAPTPFLSRTDGRGNASFSLPIASRSPREYRHLGNESPQLTLFEVQAFATGYGPSRVERCALSPRSPTRLNLSLDAARHVSISGSVVDSAGRGIEGATVRALATSVRTAQDGTFLMKLPAASGRAVVTAESERYFLTARLVEWQDEQLVTVPQLVLESPALIAGIVVDDQGQRLGSTLVELAPVGVRESHGCITIPRQLAASSPRGSPALTEGEALIKAAHEPSGALRQVRTDGTGRFSCDGLVPGPWRLRVVPFEHPSWKVPRDVIVEAGNDDVILTVFRPRPDACRLKIRLISSDTGQPLVPRDALLLQEEQEGFHTSQAKLTVDGVWLQSPALLPANWHVWACADGFATGHREVRIETSEGGDRQLDLTLTRPASVRGNVTGLVQPTGAVVTVLATGSPPPPTGWPCGEPGASRRVVRTQSDGYFEIDGLVPGPASLSVLGQGVEGTTKVVLVGGTTTDARLQAKPVASLVLGGDMSQYEGTVEIATRSAGSWTARDVLRLPVYGDPWFSCNLRGDEREWRATFELSYPARKQVTEFGKINVSGTEDVYVHIQRSL